MFDKQCLAVLPQQKKKFSTCLTRLTLVPGSLQTSQRVLVSGEPFFLGPDCLGLFFGGLCAASDVDAPGVSTLSRCNFFCFFDRSFVVVVVVEAAVLGTSRLWSPF
jgi:hypothetical protein